MLGDTLECNQSNSKIDDESRKRKVSELSW